MNFHISLPLHGHPDELGQQRLGPGLLSLPHTAFHSGRAEGAGRSLFTLPRASRGWGPRPPLPVRRFLHSRETGVPSGSSSCVLSRRPCLFPHLPPGRVGAGGLRASLRHLQGLIMSRLGPLWTDLVSSERNSLTQVSPTQYLVAEPKMCLDLLGLRVIGRHLEGIPVALALGSC